MSLQWDDWNNHFSAEVEAGGSREYTCPSCNKTDEYWPNFESAYECDNCGCLHNGLGQALRPRDEWEEDYEEDY